MFENLHGEKTSIGRGNLSFSTINLVGLAFKAKESYPDDKALRITSFGCLLRDSLDTCREQLLDRYNFQKTALKKQFPLLMNGMWNGSEELDFNDNIEEVIKQGTLGIGFIGLAECLILLTGKHHGESTSSQELGLRIVELMNSKVDEFKQEDNLNYSVLATPAEGLAGRFVKKDREKYGIVKHVNDKDYYTNSNHVPVWYKCSLVHKARTEAPYHALTLGGHIFYGELDGDAAKNVLAIKQAVQIMDANNMGYISMNHTRNRCIDCGHEDGHKDFVNCPNCGSDNVDKLQRITGYLVGGTSRWNPGKLAELNDRVTHN